MFFETTHVMYRRSGNGSIEQSLLELLHVWLNQRITGSVVCDVKTGNT